MIFCAHTHEGVGLVERHEHVFEVKTYKLGEET